MIRMIHKGGYILLNLGSSDESRIPDIRETDIASTLLSRDYKGLSNYGSNGVLEIYEMVDDKKLKELDSKGSFLGSVYGHGPGYAGAVWDKEKISPTLTTMQGGNREPMIVETTECECLGGLGEKKSNGGTQYYQQDRVYSMGDIAMRHPANIPGGSYKYLEVEEKPQIKELGNYMPSGFSASRVYDTEGLAPTIRENHGTTAGIVAIDEQNTSARYETFGTLQTDGSSPKHNNRVAEITEEDGLDEWTWEINGRKFVIRIRKLTPKECWSLMDFSSEDFSKAASVCSNTQLYKQAGNSICKNVLCAVMGQLFEGKENVYKERI